jgi:hypothetical protein
MVLLFSETTHWFHNVLRLRKVPSLQKDFAQAQRGVCPDAVELAWMMRDGDRKPARQIESTGPPRIPVKKNPAAKNPSSLPIRAGST